MCPYLSLKVGNTERKTGKRKTWERDGTEMIGKGECLWWENKRAGERESDREGSVGEFAYVPHEQACVCIWIWACSQEWD